MYQLHSLGWHSFQQLCLSVLSEILGQTVERYLDSNDGGRDGAFSGTWARSNSERLSGKFVVQCKFSTKPGAVLRVADLEDEIKKAQALADGGNCDIYVLMANAGVSGRTAATLHRRLNAAGIRDVLVLGSTWLEQQIRENKRLRMLVPRVYGLGDLSQILDDRAYAQAKAVLDSLREDLSKVVVTSAYQKAATALDDHGFVLLLGEAAAGKTTIASMLAMAAADQWGASVLKLDQPSLVVQHWNVDEPSQFFWIDDAFGVTQYEGTLVLEWNHIIPQIRSMLRKGAKIVMTSRDYIYNRAREELKEGAFPLLRESQVVIDVHALSDDERKQILYNHLKLGKQAQDFRRSIKPFLEEVADHPRFIPEIARRLADPFFTERLRLESSSIKDFVSRREQLLLEILRGLDRHSKAALALIYMRNGELESPIQLAESEAQALTRLGSDLGSCVTALNALNGSLVLFSGAEVSSWRYKHPTIGDAFSSSLIRNPELLNVFIQGSAPDKLMEQISCGDVGLQNAVIVPKSLFPNVLDRLKEYSSSAKYKTKWLSSWGAQREVDSFLSRRASREFLSMFLQQFPRTLDRVSKPRLYLDSVSEVDVAVKLHKVGLFEESFRRRFVETVSTYAIEGRDFSALEDDDISSLFTEFERSKLDHDVRQKVIPKLGSVRQEVESSYDRSEPADEHMDALIRQLKKLRRHYESDDAIRKAVETEIDRAESWASENGEAEPERTARTLGNVETSQGAAGTRSVFDDVDE